MEAMLTKEDRGYIGDIFDKKFDKKFDEKFGEMAIMIQNGFANTASKTDLLALDKKLSGRMDRLEVRLEKVEFNTRGLENRLINGPNRRLDKVEDDVRVIKSKLKIK